MILLLVLLTQIALAQDTSTLSQAGAQAMRESRFSDAERDFRRLAQRDPSNPVWRMNLGLALHSAGRFPEAIVEFDAFLKSRPQPGAIHLMAGLSRLKMRQPCEAIAPLEKAKTWDAPKSLVELADAYFGCGRYENAARTYQAALTSVGRTSRVARQAAHCYWRARLYSEAKRQFTPLSSQFAGDAEFNYEYGDTLVRVDGPGAGLPLLLRATEAAPQLLAARAETGRALLAVGRAVEAIPHLEAGAAAEPTLLLALSRAYRATGRAADAARAQSEYRAKVGARQ